MFIFQIKFRRNKLTTETANCSPGWFSPDFWNPGFSIRILELIMNSPHCFCWRCIPSSHHHANQWKNGMSPIFVFFPFWGDNFFPTEPCERGMVYLGVPGIPSQDAWCGLVAIPAAKNASRHPVGDWHPDWAMKKNSYGKYWLFNRDPYDLWWFLIIPQLGSIIPYIP